MISTRLRWPLVVILSAAILAALVAGGVHSPARVALSLWFLLVCTGMAFVPLLRIRQPLVELWVGVVASIALDTVVTTVILLAGDLSATSGFVALGSLCLVGCAAQVATAARRPRVPSTAAGGGVSNRPEALLTDLATAATMLVDDLRHGRTLDAYLRAAGMTQVSADHLHAEIYPLDRAAALLGASVPRLGAATTATADAIRAVRVRGSSMRRVRRWHGKLSGLVEVLARDLRGSDPRSTGPSRRLAMSAALAAELATLPATLRTAVIKLPACFCTFDQQPADLDLLVSRFAERHPERDRTLLIVGVRTSGSYLAPLGAAALRSSGYRDVRTLTVRPGHALLAVERDQVRSVARHGGLALLVDDPPVTGASVARAALALRRAGVAPDAIVLLLAQSDPSAVAPPVLASYETVVLPADRWAVRARLAPDAVASTLSRLVGDRLSVLTVTPACLPDAPARRGHVRALFDVGMRDRATGARVDADILVEGVGLGFLGLHALPADRGLRRFAPTIFGLSDGLLYREWLPEDRRVGRVDHAGEQAIVGPIAEYVATRRRTLPAGADLSLRQTGENPAWEVASATLSRVFGRAWPLAKVVLIDRAVKRMLLVARPSIVDGNTDLAQWFYDGDGSLVKVDGGENRFSNMGLSCFDAAFDLAGVTARTDSPSLSRRLRERHAELTNEHVDEERWLLYELAHLWGRGRTRAGTESELRRARARALQRYFGDVYFADVGVPASGPLVALDVDGVLETEQLGFPALTPAAALALRALALHGYRTVLATGRSLDDVIVRCRHYPLSGGAAEYGSAVYHSRTACGVDVVSPDSHAALDRLRAALAGTAGVHVDDGHRRSVRAFAIQHGQRVALPAAVVADALRSADVAGVRVVAGDGQTDVVAGDVDKGAGVQALIAALGEPRRTEFDRPLALAVGDSASDASLAPLADLAFAPAHAPGALRAAGFELTSRPYQAGLAQAVGALIGHAPGTCDACRMPRLTAERRILLSMLQAPERRTLGLAIQALKLAGVVAQARPKAIRHEEAA